MATAVPSRFAVLSMEDDDYKPKKTQKTTVKTANTKNKNDKSAATSKQQPKKDEKKKQSKGKKNKNNEDRQWEQWKQKDSMAVEETYEQELHQAILLSKLAYEAQVDTTGKAKEDSEQSKKNLNSKKPKKATMSLEEFNNLGATPASNTDPAPESGDCKPKESDVEFFDRIKKETISEITREKEKDILKSRQNQIDEDITSAQLRVEVEKRDELVAQLKDEVQTLKEELRQVKKRNKKLYEILSQGEMKDKASVLVEVAKLQDIRDELTNEVASLHALLEQERSKTRASSADPKTTKQTNKKRPASENA
ncbi:G kinase-anchoring protein 1-like [Neodiprion virginianus]|uniref:G kinase-anchoring protein 1-like n=1 Tax=Neodiprion fabricii TaxID=2872261 RepID=UPI001ED8F4A6|nr:G kinase-anchoring protein 1-like [Neodiprion fabricii]XP_046430788.1 G kinase-anchoring protein 1-like [Neodiprion fabricii]XP_046624531.1 G kinase-anchoring protein 1-like [Neodiprion virginianus]XP_046624532.1 G kinase-anchoring protein 1-like [Neodiprion virginianus]